MRWRRGAGLLALTRMQNGGHSAAGKVAPTNLYQGTNNIPRHVLQEAIGTQNKKYPCCTPLHGHTE
jgi:hypothetical protein